MYVAGVGTDPRDGRQVSTSFYMELALPSVLVSFERGIPDY